MLKIHRAYVELHENLYKTILKERSSTSKPEIFLAVTPNSHHFFL